MRVVRVVVPNEFIASLMYTGGHAGYALSCIGNDGTFNLPSDASLVYSRTSELMTDLIFSHEDFEDVEGGMTNWVDIPEVHIERYTFDD